MLAFIGSEGAAQAIVSRHPAPGFLDRILGLGAKNAAVVLPGAPAAEVALRLARGSLGFNGQRCTAEKIVFAPAGAEGDALVAHLAEAVAGMKVGMPWEPGVAITPLPEEGKLAAMRAYLDDALAHGARIANHGGGTGWHSLMRPAVLDGVAEGMRLWDEEQFGPILPVARYRDLALVEDWHVRSPFGQQAGVWGPESPERSRLLSSLASHVARVNVNDVCQRSPDSFGFTATDKSGFGTLSLRAALQAFSRVAILQSPDPSALA
jgi:glyceraldehyde-3-phosphate dehydrogenase (NADP+)